VYEVYKLYTPLHAENKMFVGIKHLRRIYAYIIFNTHIHKYCVGLRLVTPSELLVICRMK